LGSLCYEGSTLLEAIIYNYDTVIHTDLGHGFDHSNTNPDKSFQFQIMIN
jgi:hypothetical protein